MLSQKELLAYAFRVILYIGTCSASCTIYIVQYSIPILLLTENMKKRNTNYTIHKVQSRPKLYV